MCLPMHSPLFDVIRPRLGSTPSPYTTLFRSRFVRRAQDRREETRGAVGARRAEGAGDCLGPLDNRQHLRLKTIDRKSTRLNSSHGSISYAVFCLKKQINCWPELEDLY